ncbi:MAG TPA: ATP-binding cassette domain-containing protein [Burkholderiaceae bacterium]|jgi:phosphonate transport system ATP-binding protein
MQLELTHATIHHPRANLAAPALCDISLHVAAGEQIALIGPSGAGKTTLLHTLACAIEPASGSYQAFGATPWQAGNKRRHALRKRLFLAPQTPPLPPRQRVVTAVLAARLPQWSLWQAFKSLIKPADPRAAFDALARFQLEEKLYARVDRLSGGERQRCGMARLLVSNAQLFLVDEPLSALDPTLASATLAVLQEEASSRKATLICSLHQVELARRHFPRIIGLRDGRVVFDARREMLTDEMVAALYAGREAESPPPLPMDEALPGSVADIPCF